MNPVIMLKKEKAIALWQCAAQSDWTKDEIF